MKDQITSLIRQAILAAIPAANLPSDATNAAIELERTRDPAHGDFASSIALRLAKAARRNPRELAQLIVAAPCLLLISSRKARSRRRRLHQLSSRADRIPARARTHRRRRRALRSLRTSAPASAVLVEFVSVESHRAAARRSRTPRGLWRNACQPAAATGYRVHREYYVNDAGRQMDILAASVWLRYLELCGERFAFPEQRLSW